VIAPSMTIVLACAIFPIGEQPDINALLLGADQRPNDPRSLLSAR
jgi:hypothetical protein